MSPVGTEGTLMALVCVLGKTNNVLRIKEYSFIGVEGMNNFEINIQEKITIDSIYYRRSF
jgi:Icc-related predicted phosphoesterase